MMSETEKELERQRERRIGEYWAQAYESHHNDNEKRGGGHPPSTTRRRQPGFSIYDMVTVSN